MSAKQPVSSIYQLKITLKHSKPPIWRRIQVQGDESLYNLHQIIQIAMGWTNSHLHQFIAHGIYYSDPDLDFGPEIVSEHRVQLKQIVSEVKDTFFYEYDFGDGWEHEIVVEKIMEPEPKVRYPRCIKGKRNCPPEDIGGVWGYDDFLEAIQNAEHPEHKEYVEWIGGAFDPEAFDCEEVNDVFKQIG